MKWFRKQKAEAAPRLSFNDVLAARRSIRKYRPQPLDENLLAAVLEAGCQSPSSKGEQNYHIIAVQSEALRASLAAACNGQHWVGTAPVVLVAWSQNERVMACGQSAATVDATIAMSFMQLKAAELGLGTCWLGAFDARAVQRELALPAGASVVAVSPLGWPAQTPPPPRRKPADALYEVR